MVLNSQNMIKITVNVMYFKALLEVCTNRVWSTKKLIVKVNKSPNKEPNLFGIVERKTSLMFVKFVFTYYFRLLCIIIFACVHLLFFPSFSYRKKRTETLSLRAWELCAHVFFSANILLYLIFHQKLSFVRPFAFGWGFSFFSLTSKKTYSYAQRNKAKAVTLK